MFLCQNNLYFHQKENNKLKQNINLKYTSDNHKTKFNTSMIFKTKRKTNWNKMKYSNKLLVTFDSLSSAQLFGLSLWW